MKGLKRATIVDTGNIRYYAEAIETAQGTELKYSVEVGRCVVGNLTGIQAAKLFNELNGLLREGKWEG